METKQQQMQNTQSLTVLQGSASVLNDQRQWRREESFAANIRDNSTTKTTKNRRAQTVSQC